MEFSSEPTKQFILCSATFTVYVISLSCDSSRDRWFVFYTSRGCSITYWPTTLFKTNFKFSTVHLFILNYFYVDHIFFYIFLTVFRIFFTSFSHLLFHIFFFSHLLTSLYFPSISFVFLHFSSFFFNSASFRHFSRIIRFVI